MTNSGSNHHPSVVARYGDAKDAAAAHGYQLSVTGRAEPVFALGDNGTTLHTFSDIAHVEDFLRGIARQRNRRRAQ